MCGFWFSLNREAMPTISFNQRGLSGVETRFFGNLLNCTSLNLTHENVKSAKIELNANLRLTCHLSLPRSQKRYPILKRFLY